MSKSKTDTKLVTPRTSIHVVFFSCPDCGDETSDVKICNSCGTPMRVIDVVEKFGEEAEKFLKKVEESLKEEMKASNPDVIDDDEPNIILMGDEDALDDDGGIDPSKDDGGELGVIFGDSDDEEDTLPRENVKPDADLAEALDLLDEEEDDDIDAKAFGFDDGDIPTL